MQMVNSYQHEMSRWYTGSRSWTPVCRQNEQLLYLYHWIGASWLFIRERDPTTDTGGSHMCEICVNLGGRSDLELEGW